MNNDSFKPGLLVGGITNRERAEWAREALVVFGRRTGLDNEGLDTATSLDEWEEIDGPQTRVGVERWYRHPSGATVWFCDDQGSVVYEVYTSGEDG